MTAPGNSLKLYLALNDCRLIAGGLFHTDQKADAAGIRSETKSIDGASSM
jgi:hypothetical protein